MAATQLRQGRRTTMGSGLVLGLVVAVAGGACGGGGTGGTSQGPIAMVDSGNKVFASDSSACLTQAGGLAGRKRTAFMTDCLRRLRVARTIWPESNRQGSLTWLIPEFNDEQRFAVDAGHFGPVAMIFASPSLGGFDTPGPLLEHGTRGLLAAVIFVDTTPSATLPPPYATLGLEPGMNCLWISFTGAAAPSAWGAYVTHTKSAAPCDPNDPATKLAVRRTVYGEAASPRYVPPVARFTHDDHDAPLLGVKCLRGWCDVGPGAGGTPSFTPLDRAAGLAATVGPTLTAGLPAQEAATVLTAASIAAWHDEQVLAAYSSAGAAIPGKIHASLIPTSITYRDPAGFAAAAGVPVAVLWLYEDPAGTTYATRWHLQKGPNIIHIQGGDMSWKATVRTSVGAVLTGGTDLDIFRHRHFDAAVISTARFRWASTDDGIWVACGQACCRMDAM